jgi:hypothetical protein
MVVYVVLLTCFVSLLVTSVAFVSYEWVALKRSQESELAHITQLLTEQVKTSIEHKRPNAAKQELAILKALPDIESAYLFSKQGSLFSFYRRDDVHAALPANYQAAKEILIHPN